jgi:sporulation protein YlmC with PRC-barrel domain
MEASVAGTPRSTDSSKASTGSNTDNPLLRKLGDSGQTVAVPAEDIRGRGVKDNGGNDIGKVADLLIDEQEHKVRFLVIEAGGFLGIGEKESFIPVDAITRISGDEVWIDRSGEHVAGAPRYDPDLALDDRGYYENLYGYYGLTPYWGVGYPYPGYPMYPE